MEFKNNLTQLAQRTEKIKDHILTEEATKTSIIMPFFQILGYDIFNPSEFLPEFTCDVADRKGEKIDYAIMREGKPIMLIEAKPYDNCLEKHTHQLIRYFAASEAKFAVLTNGVLYKFFTDLDKSNIMDDTPFFEFNLLNFRDEDVHRLKKFRKDTFDVSSITGTAEELKYKELVKGLFKKQLENIDEEFLNYILSQICPTRRRTTAMLEKFKPWVQEAFNDFIEQTMEDRILPMLKNKTEESEPDAASAPDDIKIAEAVMIERKEHSVITTPEEIETYFIIKSILCNTVDVKSISYKDTASYFAIIYENNVYKWVCRIYLSEYRKMMVLPTDDKKGEKIYFESIDEIYNHKDKVIEAVKRYI